MYVCIFETECCDWLLWEVVKNTFFSWTGNQLPYRRLWRHRPSIQKIKYLFQRWEHCPIATVSCKWSALTSTARHQVEGKHWVWCHWRRQYKKNNQNSDLKVEIAAGRSWLTVPHTAPLQGFHFDQDSVSRAGVSEMLMNHGREERQHAIKMIEYLRLRGDHNTNFLDQRVVRMCLCMSMQTAPVKRN